jgi:predicted nucleotidyltransferase
LNALLDSASKPARTPSALSLAGLRERAAFTSYPGKRLESGAPEDRLVVSWEGQYTVCAMDAALAAKHGIVLALQFGSLVTGKTHERSDVDIAVLLERPVPSLDAYADLLHDLQQLFPDRQVDLALLNHADPFFLKKVTEHCRILFGPDDRLHRLKIFAFKRYQDHRRFLALERAFVEQYIAAVGGPR